MSEQSSIESDPIPHHQTLTVWQENHGNLLLVFFAVILLIGALILLYRQNRFVPVRFPEADAIDNPTESAVSNPANADEGIVLSVIGAGSDNGMIRIAFYESANSFNDPESAFLKMSAPITEGEAKILIPFEMVPEKFAIAAYHDENSDETLNRNRLGIPNERYGYSEDARSITGPPAYEDALTDRPNVGDTMTVSIR
ncbi:hypothetical protein K227x_20010 [Rubripirellula lacrimiformis]|uniref:DUF2141 domain-containing protein n=1 Tax=Rubripirellula lacrimiformis TaxID=1930273 RepID=A0A517N904_9BACT|nr:DUF2141 domain-containing protein [Rubripirellula lacrimiformis]QDT03617.1 hypothetical protein K227x_20010 [Rubripirellula lacrimiformis]